MCVLQYDMTEMKFNVDRECSSWGGVKGSSEGVLIGMFAVCVCVCVIERRKGGEAFLCGFSFLKLNLQRDRGLHFLYTGIL